MPIKTELALKAQALKKGFKPGTPRYNAYVYGTLNKIEQLKKKGVR